MNHTPLVLVVDDVPEYRERLLPGLVEILGGRICKAANVREALGVAAEHTIDSEDPIDLIILDMHLPMSAEDPNILDDAGVRFLRQYRLAHCPIVVFTAYPSFANCVAAIQAGASAYIPKVSKDNEGGPEALCETCKRLLGNREQKEAAVPPTKEWIRRNRQRLGTEFDGKWLAFIDQAKLTKEQAEGLSVMDGLVLLVGNSYEDVRNQVIHSPAVLTAKPTILMVRGAQSGSCGGEEKVYASHDTR
jgi:CheY-like chemotaxis protein